MTNSKRPAKRIFVSDIHMNAGRSFSNSKKDKSKKHPYEWLGKAEIKRFADFLNYVNQQEDISEFILLGDKCDDWVCPVDEVPPTFDKIM